MRRPLADRGTRLTTETLTATMQNSPSQGHARHAAASWAQRLGSLIFAGDFKQRRRIAVVLTTLVTYGICAALLALGAAKGLFDPAARMVAALCVLTPVVFFIAVRSGWNLRFASPSLAFPQAIAAQTLIAFGYAVTGVAHPATLALLAMVMVFGMFEMHIKSVWALLGYTVVLMGLSMGWCTVAQPAVYPLDLELMYFAVMTTVLTVISALSIALGTMRSRLRQQKLELKQALQHIRQIATHDELTGLPNRRHMLALLGEHVSRHARGGQPFAIALADIDHFKSVNDRYGHRVGDDALIFFAQHARAHLRTTDIAGRWGGEEFLLLLPASSPGDPTVGIERLRSALAGATVSATAPDLRIAFSAGVAYYVEGEAIDDLVERADKALYLAKREGRNQTRVALAG